MNEPPETTSSQPSNLHGSRSKGRELALKFLFGADLRGPYYMEVLDDFVVHQDARGPSVAFARGLIEGTFEVWERLDRVLTSLAKNWALKRMATTDRNILRLGCYELLCRPETPAAVVINEAVELAKKYGTSNSGAFVNGILDRVRIRRDDGEDLLALSDAPSEP